MFNCDKPFSQNGLSIFNWLAHVITAMWTKNIIIRIVRYNRKRHTLNKENRPCVVWLSWFHTKLSGRLLDPHPEEGPINHHFLSVRLPVHLSVGHFSQEWHVSFFWFCMINTLVLEYLKTDRGKEKGPKRPQNRVFWIFWKILPLAFPGNNLKLKLIL